MEPMLRFKADDGSEFPAWVKKTLGDLGEFIKGAPLSKADIAPEGNPMILYGELYTTYGEVAYEIARSTNRNVDDKYRSKIGDVLIPTSGETPEEISTATCVMKEGVILAGDLYIYRTVDEIDGRIMSYLLNHQANKAISCIAQGKSVVHVQAKELRNITVVFPPEMGEQRKIVDFLSAVDDFISAQKAEVAAWEKRKKGVMQKLFSQEVRFKADDGSDFPDWEEKTLGEIIREYREYHEKDGTYEHVSLTKDGVISKTERYDRDYLVKCVDKKYRVTHMNDICYNPANLKFGVICRNTYGDGIFSPIYVTYRVNESYDPIFIEALVVRDAFIQQALRFQEGTVYERMSVSPSDFESMFVSVPSFPEQRKIADCLTSLDDVIAKAKDELDAWRELKKGLLQQMFV